MSTQTKTTLKSYFETGDKPTQSQFADLIDSMALVTDLAGGASNNEAIPVEGLKVEDIGKLAMLDYDGKIKLYQETPGTAGIKGKWQIKFNSVSSENVHFSYEERNGQYIGASSGNWLGSATTPEEEATAFISYMSNNYSNVLFVTSGLNADEVLLEQKSAKQTEQQPAFNNGNVQVNTMQNPEAGIPKAPKRICVGVIKNVDETNHTAVFEDIITLPVLTVPDVTAILSDAESINGEEHAFTLAKLIAVPTNGGIVRAVTEEEMQNEDFTFNSLQNALYFFIKPHAESGRYYFLKRGLG